MIGNKKNIFCSFFEFMGNTKISRQRGVTLVEILLVLAIFSIIGILLVNIFIMALNSQRHISSRQRSLVNIRHVAESISQQIRTSEIYYDYYKDASGRINIQNPQEVLALRNQKGDRYIYYNDKNQNSLILIIMKNDGGKVINEWSTLTDSKEINIKKFFFYINPPSNPFSEERCNESGNCLVGSCTVNDPESDKSGFCCCTQNSDCFSGNCDIGQESQDIFSKYCGSLGKGGTCLPFGRQPSVTVVLEFESVSAKVQERKIVNLQTTVSSRVYKR